ncbi:MAG: bifunctional 3-(3-hydroxy-phenyl)propionate/3-hydroxycinnamic acid hydroxylase [Myxococcales bacterium]
MRSQETIDVAIVGAGPVGLTLSAKLAQMGLKVVCYEENQALYAFPRAVGLDDESLRAFHGLGIGERELDPCLMNCAGIKYYGEHGQFLTMIHPKERPYGHFKGASFYQPFLENLLLQRACALGAKVQFGARVVGLELNGDHALLMLQGETGVRHQVASYVVGCDGSRSFVRKNLRIGFKGTTFEQRWLVVDTANDVWPERYAEVWCSSARPTVTIPRRQGFRRWEFMLKPGEDAADFDTLDKIRPLLEQRVPVDRIEIERFNVYTFHSRVADSYRRGRVFLAGDAAHVIPPFMAQGMAAGVRDAENLAWKLAGVIKGRLREQVLDSYETERRPHLLAMGKLSERAGAFMMPQSRLRSLTKDFVVRALHRIPGVASAVEEARMRPDPIYRAGLFSRQPSDTFAGSMFPQPLVRDTAGVDGLLDLHLGAGFSLVCYGAAERPLLAALQERLTRLGCRALQIAPQGLHVDQRFKRLPDATLVEDRHNAIGAWLRDREASCFLLRPDRYVIASFSLYAQSELVAWLDGELLNPGRAELSPPLERAVRAGKSQPTSPGNGAAGVRHTASV